VPRSIPQSEVPQAEYMTSWSRQGWPAGRRKNRKFASLKSAQILANKLASGERDGLPPAIDIQIRMRTVGDWQILARKGGAR